jgi:hypothetical protein
MTGEGLDNKGAQEAEHVAQRREYWAGVLAEAQGELERVPALEARWRIRAMFGDGAIMSVLSDDEQEKLHKADIALSSLPEVRIIDDVLQTIKEIRDLLREKE